MIFEYLRLTGAGGSFWSLDFAARVVFLLLTGLALVMIGFKIKGVWGAGLAFCAGVLLFLYNEGILRF